MNNTIYANGYNKRKIIAQIKKYNDGTIAEEDGDCMYITKEGNRCFIGAFIPEGHPALTLTLNIRELLFQYPSLWDFMPYCTSDMLYYFQRVHDTCKEDSTYIPLEKWFERKGNK